MLPLLGINPQFLGCPDCSLFTVPALYLFFSLNGFLSLPFHIYNTLAKDPAMLCG